MEQVVRVDGAGDDKDCGIETNKKIADYILGQIDV